MLSEKAVFTYKVDNYYAPESEGSIKFDDKELDIDWIIKHNDIKLSAKDLEIPAFKDAKLFNFDEQLY
ncbi:MAG: dTDP-4-dehydrorhamnose 3,5-epimerase family protein [Bacteroidota bacterium]